MRSWIIYGIRTLLLLLIPVHGQRGGADDEEEVTEHPLSMTGVAGGKVNLPCNITPPTHDDDVALILWYKDESTSPLYSVDARRGNINHAHHVTSDMVSRRAYLDTIESPAILQLEALSRKDEGIYRCRVDFRKARTRNSDIILSIIVPPKKPIITDQNGEILQSLIGPYNEGDRLNLVCEAEGGSPLPTVTWWRESVLLDNTYDVTSHGVVRNELELPILRRHDLMAVLTCQAANNNISIPSSSSVTVDMNFRPVEVKIENDRHPLSARKPVDLVCRAKGSRPPAILSWWKGSSKMKRTKDRISIDGYVTTSVLTFTPSSEDSGKYLSCRAENPLIPGSAVEDGWKLEVHYVPQLSLRLGSKLNHAHIQENNDVYFECNIRANPWVSEIGWRFEGREILTNITYGVIVSNQSLVLQKVHRGNRGYYTCTATNVEGQGESNPVYLRVQYAPICKPGQKNIYGVARHEAVKVACEVDADPAETTFRWDFNSSTETIQIITFVSDGSRSTATYIPRKEQDYGTLLCWGKNTVGFQQEPCVYSIIPAGPPDSPNNCTFVNKTETSLVLECAEGYDGGLPQYFIMEVHDTGQHRLRANVTNDIPVMAVEGLPAGATFVIVVYSANAKGRSRGVVLRAKTLPAPVRQTQTETMWQFNMTPVLFVLVGVVCVLVLIAVIIVVFKFMKEKSRRDKKHAAPLKYDEYKMQPNLPKDCLDKIFSYSTSEEKCPDIIPEANSHMDHMKNADSERNLWTMTRFSGDKTSGLSTAVAFSRQLPESVKLIPDVPSSREQTEFSTFGASHSIGEHSHPTSPHVKGVCVLPPQQSKFHKTSLSRCSSEESPSLTDKQTDV